MRLVLKTRNLVILSLIFLIFIKCKKSTINFDLTEQSSISKLTTEWLDRASNSNSSSLFIDSIKRGINLEDLFIVQKTALSTTVFIPVEYNNKDLGLLITFGNRTRAVRFGVLMDMKFPKDIIYSKQKFIYEAFTGETKFISGSMSFYTINNKFLGEYGFSEGKLKYQKYIQKGETLYTGTVKSNSIGGISKQSIRANSCYDFYLVTYWSDGSVDRAYIGTSCTAGGSGSGWCEQTGKLNSSESLIVSQSCDDGVGGSPDPSGGNNSTDIINGPKICWSSIQLNPQGVGSTTNNAKIWGIPASYNTPTGRFNTFFGIDVYSPNRIVSYSGVKQIESLVVYFSLWTTGDITKSPTDASVTFSSYAQRKIIADAIDWASLNASKGVIDGETVTSNGYKSDFKDYFREYISIYLPGATINILNGLTPGAINFKGTYGDPENCQ